MTIEHGSPDWLKIPLWGTNNYGFGIASNTLQYSSQGNHVFYNSTNNAMTLAIDSAGNTSCYGNLQTNNTVVVRGNSEGDTATLFLATPFDNNTANQRAWKCALIARGISTYGRSKLHFCLNGAADNTFPTQNASLSIQEWL